MKKIYIKVNSTGKVYSYEPHDSAGKTLKLKPGDLLLVEMDQVIEEAKVVEPAGDVEAEEGSGIILKLIEAEDRRFCCQLKNQAREYIAEAQEKVARHGLDMKILNADLSYDQKKLTFYFSAKNRVDFRGLVLDMVKSFNKLIRLQQVGSRDEAKYFGGIGKCGRELCCSRFLDNPETITLEMAELQELSTAGTSKLSGCCGKLMCCLSYEAENYPSRKKKVGVEKTKGVK